ncbi:PREDICTED: F-box/kelch-repeat protein At1g80440-like [Ipomoea nil]|uniref:F-box/kelch-repeat protein At1g80440-like n=1 Tax=Ipomoea nil TaxID=35883 RepID=UPI000901141D|nr:PREDICTED: F-box/kelch-repeat protein At1g80440-like [Ipomoea nil]
MELIPGLPNDLAFECLIRISFDQFPKASSVCRAWKAVIKQPEFLRRRKASGLTRPVIAICQSRFSLSRLDTVGFRLTLFDPVKRRWHDFPPIPEVVERMPVLCSVVGIGAELAVIGGCDPVTRRYLNSVFIYNFFSATWRRGADMPGEDRLFFGCAASEDGGTVVVAGGRSSTTTLALKSTLAYDVARDTWTTLMYTLNAPRQAAEDLQETVLGKWIGGFTSNIGSCPPLMAEAWAALRGIQTRQSS